jgi:DNA-binding Xre family transcriptional regulator
MTNKIGYVWHLRRLMAERGMFATTDLVPLLAERGIGLSREQVYRLVTRTPERLNLNVLVALCDILDCRADDLIAPLGPTAKGTAAKTITTSAAPPAAQRPRPRRARILPVSAE